MSLIALSNMINREGLGYAVDDKNVVNHLLYMDDLKIFAKNEDQLRQTMHIIKTFSDDVKMDFGLDKCGTVVVKRGKRVNSQNIQLNDGSTIKNLDQNDVYKYLGVDENDDIDHKGMKSKITQEYYRRVRMVLRSKLNSKNKIIAINTLAVPVPTYSFGIVNWRKDEINKMDRKTRKLLTMHGLHHPKADVERIYIKRSNGGRGLIELESAYNIAIVGLSDYIKQGSDKFMKMVKKHEDNKPKCNSVTIIADVIRAQHPKPQNPDQTPRNDNTLQENLRKRSQNANNALKASIEKAKLECVKNKPLHGQFFRELNRPFVDKESTLAWLRSSDLKGETESLIIAAQDQALNTRYHQRKILKLQIDSKCRMCNEAEETISHILSGCTTIAASEYTNRHNKVASYIHWTICKDLGIEVPDKWYMHVPQPVINTQHCTIMWDYGIQTDRTIRANRPDIVFHNREAKTCLLIDVAIPDDHNIMIKEAEKISKYKDLEIEIKRMWNTKASIVPVVIGTLGVVKAGLQKQLDVIPGKPTVFEAQKVALLGSAHILRKVLS